jgi:hypothetical protein
MLPSHAMTPEQKKFLQGRLRNATIEQPDLKRLKPLLLGFGGDFLVAPTKVDADLPLLMGFGFLMSGPVVLKKMRASSCHQNVATVWRSRVPRIVGIATGYALSDDGLWRQHSWGLLRNGVLETTVERIKYFGILLTGADADDFASRNSD